jgi:hypothetical protein
MSSYSSESSITSGCSIDSYEETPLINAILDNDFKTFELLLENKKAINEISDEGYNPLQIAFQYFDDDIGFKYIEKLMELKFYNLEDCILLSTSNIKCFTFLKEKNINMYDYICPKTKDTLLISSCNNGNLEIVANALKNTKNIYNKNILGLNCFLATSLNPSSKNIYEIMVFLLKNTKDLINSVDSHKNNFLILLEMNCYLNKNDRIKTIIIKYLIDNKISINHKNIENKNILMCILENYSIIDWESMYDYFYFYIKQGIDLDHCDNHNMNILDNCIEQVNTRIKLTSKSKINLLQKEISSIRKIINKIVEYKSLTKKDKESLTKLKENLSSKKLI